MRIELFSKCGPVHVQRDEYEDITGFRVDEIARNARPPDEDFAEYFHPESLSNYFENGYLEFYVENDTLMVKVTYDIKEGLDRSVNYNIINELKEYTLGQMSDGIGEGFEQHPCMYLNGDDVYISPWYRGQVLEHRFVN